MSAVALVARAAMRRQWRSLVVVTLLIGIAGAAVLTATAGARRTSSSLERFQGYSRSADVELEVERATPKQLAALRRDPSVGAVGVLHQFTIAYPDGTLVPAAAAVDSTFGRVVDRPRVIEGRLPRPTSADELAIGETLATRLHVRVGDTVSVGSYSVAQTDMAKQTGETGPPRGPKVRFRIVGVVRRPLDLGVRGSFGGVAIPTPAFYAQYRDEIGSFVGALLRVRARHGAAETPEVVNAARHIFGDSLFGVTSLTLETEGARDAIDVLTVALWIFAGIAAIAGATAVGIVTVRQIGTVDRDQETLVALGLTRPRRALAAAALVVPAAIGGGVLAVLVAALLSPLFPFGLARKAEIDPGFRIDRLALGLGLVAVVAFVVLVAAVAAWRVARSVTHERETRGAERPSTVARAAAGVDASPALTTGLRMALEPGRGARAVPVRSAFFGMAFGTLGIVAVLVFGSSLDHLAATPRLYGWSWDTSINVDQTVVHRRDPKLCGDVTTRVVNDRNFATVAAVCQEGVEVDGHAVTGWGFTSLRGSLEPTIVAGRAPRGPNEIALGSVALDTVGKHIGDTVRVRGERTTKRFHVVGQTVLPSLSPDDPEALADGAALTSAGLARIFDPIDVPNVFFLARFAPGVDPSKLPHTPAGELKFVEDRGRGTLPTVPVEIDRLRQVDDLPLVLGSLLGLLATVAVAHAIVLATRRRRRDLAVLRTIGFKRRDVRATLAYQATTLALLGLVVGIPLGIVVGRLVWEAVADGVGVAATIDASAIAVGVVALGALLVVNLIAALAATSAIHDQPATVLASE